MKMKSSFSIDEDDEPVPDAGTMDMEMNGSVDGIDPLKKKTLQLLAGIGGLCVVLTAILVAVAATGLLWGTITGTFDDSDLVQHTTEYQLVLHMERFSSNRRKGIEPMLLFFGQKAGVNVSWEHGYESVREQQQLQGDLCDAHYSPHVRIRNYMTGPKQGTSTLDLKLDEAISETLAGLAPYQPNDKQRLTTFDKVEHDVHPCPSSSKYSREARLKDIPYKPTFAYCSELAELFPYFFSIPMQSYQTVTMSEPDPWYSYVYEGNLLVNGISTPFKLDWTIHYDNFHDALNDGATSDGEMSFRVWALDGGRGPYDPASIAFSDSIYSALLAEFGSNGYKKCDGVPVSEYGALGPLHAPTPSPSPSAFPTPLSFPPDRRANF